MKNRALWFIFNIYGWLVFVMSVVTAIIIQAWWVVLIGVIGYQLVLILELTLGRDLGKTGMVRLARAEQENRELRVEQNRLLGAIQTRDEEIAVLRGEAAAPEEPEPEIILEDENLPKSLVDDDILPEP